MDKIKVKNRSPLSSVCGVPPLSVGYVTPAEAERWRSFLHPVENIEAAPAAQEPAEERATLDTVPAPGKISKRRNKNVI